MGTLIVCLEKDCFSPFWAEPGCTYSSLHLSTPRVPLQAVSMTSSLTLDLGSGITWIVRIPQRAVWA